MRSGFWKSFSAFTATLLIGCEPVETSQRPATMSATKQATADGIGRVVKPENQWNRELSAAQYHVLREKGTEPPFNNEFHDNKQSGTYVCAACGLNLYSSDHKFDSGTGWPSFFQAIADGHVKVSKDVDRYRDELTCARCDGHLGHIFDDGPNPTGKRHCINSAAMKFVPLK